MDMEVRTRGRGRPVRGEAPALDRSRLMTVLLDLVRREGLEAVTMRRVAAEAGVSVRLLYDHVRDRAEMIELACEMITAEAVPETPIGTWRSRLEAVAYAVRRGFIAYPGLGAWVLSQAGDEPMPRTPRRIRAEVRQALSDAGLAPDRVEAAYLAFVAFTMGHLALTRAASDRRSELDVLFESGLDMLLSGFESVSLKACRDPASTSQPL